MTDAKDSVLQMIAEFAAATSLERIEHLADKLAASGDMRAAAPLIERLGDAQVQSDSDVEDAVCGALVDLGIMKRLGNLTFCFVDESALPSSVTTVISANKLSIPTKYFRQLHS